MDSPPLERVNKIRKYCREKCWHIYNSEWRIKRQPRQLSTHYCDYWLLSPSRSRCVREDCGVEVEANLATVVTLPGYAFASAYDDVRLIGQQ